MTNASGTMAPLSNNSSGSTTDQVPGDSRDASISSACADLERDQDSSEGDRTRNADIRRSVSFIRSLGGILGKKKVTITEYDPTFRVIYLGNVLTGWAKGDGCVEKPLATLWKNYRHSTRPDISMRLTVGGAGLKALTKEHGVTEYFSSKITYCIAPGNYPRVFCWIYRHEGKKLRQELRCHAVLCKKSLSARCLATSLQNKQFMALTDFRREKISRQNARLSLANVLDPQPCPPRRRLLLTAGAGNYKPPIERSRSAPRLCSIDESQEEQFEQGSGNTSGTSGGVPRRSSVQNFHVPLYLRERRISMPSSRMLEYASLSGSSDLSVTYRKDGPVLVNGRRLNPAPVNISGRRPSGVLPVMPVLGSTDPMVTSSNGRKTEGRDNSMHTLKEDISEEEDEEGHCDIQKTLADTCSDSSFEEDENISSIQQKLPPQQPSGSNFSSRSIVSHEPFCAPSGDMVNPDVCMDPSVSPLMSFEGEATTPSTSTAKCNFIETLHGLRSLAHLEPLTDITDDHIFHRRQSLDMLPSFFRSSLRSVRISTVHDMLRRSKSVTYPSTRTKESNSNPCKQHDEPDSASPPEASTEAGQSNGDLVATPGESAKDFREAVISDLLKKNLDVSDDDLRMGVAPHNKTAAYSVSNCESDGCSPLKNSDTLQHKEGSNSPTESQSPTGLHRPVHHQYNSHSEDHGSTNGFYEDQQSPRQHHQASFQRRNSLTGLQRRSLPRRYFGVVQPVSNDVSPGEMSLVIGNEEVESPLRGRFGKSVLTNGYGSKLESLSSPNQINSCKTGSCFQEDFLTLIGQSPLDGRGQTTVEASKIGQFQIDGRIDSLSLSSEADDVEGETDAETDIKAERLLRQITLEEDDLSEESGYVEEKD